METKLLNEISKFRLYSNYQSNHTLTENFNIIQEQLGPEIKKLFSTITKNGKTELKSFFKGKSILDNLGNELKTVDDLLKAIDNQVLSEISLKEIKTFFINNSKNKGYVDTLIDNMVKSDGFINKYSKLTVDDAKKELIKKGYTPEKTQQIVNKFVDNSGKFKIASEIFNSVLTDIKANSRTIGIYSKLTELEKKEFKEFVTANIEKGHEMESFKKIANKWINNKGLSQSIKSGWQTVKNILYPTKGKLIGVSVGAVALFIWALATNRLQLVDVLKGIWYTGYDEGGSTPDTTQPENETTPDNGDDDIVIPD